MEQKLKPIHLACQKDETRPNMRLIKIANNIAMATNGHILVKIDLTKNSALSPEELKTLEGKHIDMDVWKEIHKCDTLEFFEESIDCFRGNVRKTFYYTTPNGELFSINSIVEEIKKAGEEKKRLMTYNATFIEILSKIFQSEALHFSFSPGGKGTVVFPNESEGMFAILIPMVNEGINRYIFI